MVLRLFKVLMLEALAGWVFGYTFTPSPWIQAPGINSTLPVRDERWIKKDVLRVLSVTNGGKWGYWHEPVFCPRESYAVGYRLKIEQNQMFGDDTALNAIRLSCMTQNGHFVEELITEEGPWGDWYDWGYCSNASKVFSFLIAFVLKVEPNQGLLDDTAANDVRFLCGTLYSPPVVTSASHNGKGPFGSYGALSDRCSAESAICGIRTKIEEQQGDGDDTALNDVQFYCCKRPEHPSINKSDPHYSQIITILLSFVILVAIMKYTSNCFEY